ncbi:MAG: nitrogen fixation protein NifQ [Sulfuricellaceae bacterium]|jgi:nitrogen fixation protein NifQ
MSHYRLLLEWAKDPADVATRAFAGALSVSAGALPRPLGLMDESFRSLLGRYFPEASNAPEWTTRDMNAGCTALRAEEYDDLVALLLEHRSRDGDETTWLASAVAAACLGNDHLWQDLGLASRDELSALLRDHFGPLFAKNTGNMKWKKFFYKQLCDRAEVKACAAPSCAVCDDYRVCFGSEDGAAKISTTPVGQVT